MDKYLPNIIVALIGNMNNNHFAIKRYLEGEGFHCDLYLFDNLPEHFLPINDTWEIDKHQGSIKKLNRGIPFIDFFKKKIDVDFKQYDICIGTGLTPYYFYRLGIKLDIFIPYGSDLYELPFKKKWSFESLKSFALGLQHNFFVYKNQKNGILATSKIFTVSHMKIIQDALVKLNRTTLPLSTPMVFIEPLPLNIDFSSYLDFKKLNSFDFKIISHSRQMWGENLGLDSKGNNKLIKGFSLFAENNTKACLVLFEYGPSIEKSKQLINKLNISDKVIWVKKMPRKLIYGLLNEHADMGADQFETGYFGSTAYELMAHGLPVLNYLNSTPEEFKKNLKRPFPPLLNVKSPEQISEAIQKVFSNKELRSRLGKQAKDYFNEYLGKGAAEVYIKEIYKIHKIKESEYL